MTPTRLPGREGPSKTEPTDTEPADTEPADTEPADTEPAETEPADTEPADTEPAETEPADTEPVDTEPADTEPADTESAVTESAVTESVEMESAKDAESGAEPVAEARAGRWLRAGAGALIAALVLGGGGFLYGAHELRSAAPARNHALTDTEATTRVAGDVGSALARIFSYTPDGTAAAERSARTVLDGRAARQYDALFAQVRDDLTEQRVTLSTRVVRTGVVELDGDKARLLVFLDQTSHKGGSKAAAATAAAQLSVTARLEGDRWRIVDIKAR